jgi:hypothetical protein
MRVQSAYYIIRLSYEFEEVIRTYPAIIIFMQKADELTGTDFEFVIHRRLEIELNTVDIVKRRRISTPSGNNSASTSDDNSGSTSSSNFRNRKANIRDSSWSIWDDRIWQRVGGTFKLETDGLW